jgi:nucleoside-diphosphate-sugar epimerase
VRWISCDLLAPGSAERLIDSVRPTHLLHLAWDVTPGRYWTAPDNLAWLAASLDLAKAFLDFGGQRMVGVGTCAEYDWSHTRMDERLTPTAPDSVYGAAKSALCEVLSRIPPDTGVSIAWARLFWMYGPGEHPSRLIPSVVQSLLQGRHAAVSDGLQIRDYLHVADAAHALAELTVSNVEGPVNIASGRPLALRELISTCAAVCGSSHLVQYGAHPGREGEPPVVTADTTRLNTELNWAPQRTLLQGMTETVNWWRGRIALEEAVRAA